MGTNTNLWAFVFGWSGCCSATSSNNDINAARMFPSSRTRFLCGPFALGGLQRVLTVKPRAGGCCATLLRVVFLGRKSINLFTIPIQFCATKTGSRSRMEMVQNKLGEGINRSMEQASRVRLATLKPVRCGSKTRPQIWQPVCAQAN